MLPAKDDIDLAFVRDFDYSALPGPSYNAWEATAWRLRDRIVDGKERELARCLVPLMCVVLESTPATLIEAAMIDVREEAIRMLGEMAELLDERALQLLRASVVEDDAVEVAWIAASVLDDFDEREGNAAWGVYTARSDCPDRLKLAAKPTKGLSPA